MKFPIISSFSKPKSVMTQFKGINSEDGLYDAVNITLDSSPETRKARTPVMLFSSPPDQIITCNNRLFFRFSNTLKEIVKDSFGMFCEGENQYTLNNLDPTTDRKLILWDENIYVLPDGIKLGPVDNWQKFANDCTLSVALPFQNPRTLFYTSGYSGGEVCDDSVLLKTGAKLKFSWLPQREFTIVSTETAFSYLDDGSEMLEGTRVTLNDDVPNYNSLPSTGNITYCVPENRPIFNSLQFGYNHRLTIKGNKISFNNTDTYYNYELNLSDFLRLGQTVKISGSSLAVNNKKAKITAISNYSITFDVNFETSYEPSRKVVTITPLIPEFSHLLLTEDRIFGIDNTEGKLYISALNKPFLFYDNPQLPEDSWSIRINEPATGITLWKDNIICFTESGGFRVLGYTALNFGLRQLSLSGIKKGCDRSLVRIGDTLYYCSARGVMKYSGGSDKKISGSVPNISDIKMAVTNGVYAYMLGNDRIWVYNTDTDVWWSENAEDVREIFYYESERCLCTGNAIYSANTNKAIFTSEEVNAAVDWNFKLPLLPNKESKKVQPLYCTLNFSEHSDFVFSISFKAYGESVWKNLGVYAKKGEGSVKIPLYKGYCNGFWLKFEGTGMFCPESITVYYRSIT